MVLVLLKEYFNKKIPVYLGEKRIQVVAIYDEFSLVDIKFTTESTVFAVDLVALSSEPYIEKSICIKRLLS